MGGRGWLGPDGLFFEADLNLGGAKAFPALSTGAVVREGLEEYVLMVLPPDR
jgi:hypothetical protein